MATIDDLANVIETVVDDKIRKTKKQSGSAIATVNSKDVDGTIWVTFEGGVEKTPITTVLADVEPGDRVAVRIEKGRSYIDGNATSPSASVRTVNVVRETADDAAKAAESAIEDAAIARTAAANAQESADEADKVAKATNQHFWHRAADPDEDGAGTGAFVTDEEQTDFLAAIAAGTEPTETRPLHNLFMNAEGILLRAAKRVRAAFLPSGVAFYDGQGNLASNIIASFGISGAQIGKSGAGHAVVSDDGLKAYGANGTTVIAHLGYGDTVNSAGATVKSFFFTAGQRGNGNIGRYSIAEGASTVASGEASHASGLSTTAAGFCSHAEGHFSTATGSQSHAEGNSTQAVGSDSHAEGMATQAVGFYSHAEGSSSYASGTSSHAGGNGTRAVKSCQTAVGKYNVEDAGDGGYGDYAVIVGNGTSDSARSNAITVKWSGDVECGTVNGVDLTQLPFIQRGTVSPAALAASSSGSTAITFADEFSASPTVIVGIRGQTQTEGIGRCSAWASNVSATGFTLNFRNDFTSSRTFGAYWVAVGGGTAGGSGGGGDTSALEQRIAELEADMQALAEATAYVGANHIAIDGTTVADELNPITSGTIDGMEV